LERQKYHLKLLLQLFFIFFCFQRTVL